MKHPLQAPAEIAVHALDAVGHQLSKVGIALNRVQTTRLATDLIEKIKDVDPVNAAVVAKTLEQAECMATLMRDTAAQLQIMEQHEQMKAAYDSIRVDAKRFHEQSVRGTVSLPEKFVNSLIHVTRGSIAARLNAADKRFEKVLRHSERALEKETATLEAYIEFRKALQASRMAIDILATKQAVALKAAEGAAQAAVVRAKASGLTDAESAGLGLERDTAIAVWKDEEKKADIIKRCAENLAINYHGSETVMAAFRQTNEVKSSLYAQGVTFFQTCRTLSAGLAAALTQHQGLHAATKALQAQKEGLDSMVGTLAQIHKGNNEAALKEAHGPTLKAEKLRELIDSITTFREDSIRIAAQARKEATENALLIEKITEEGKRKMAEIALREIELRRELDSLPAA